MTRLLWVVLVCVGCAGVPDGVDETGRPEILALSAAWADAGLGDLTGCPVQRWARVSPEEFEDVCGAPSCQHSGTGKCTLACTPTHDVSVAYWDESARPNDPGEEHFARAHEQVHAWLKCTTGDADTDHTDSVAWDALDGIGRELRAMQDP